MDNSISNKRINCRNSNLELLRIIAMVTIIMHHYVVNSGVTACYDFNNITLNMVFLQLWGMWGKTAINVFILISGYFMCTLDLTCRRYLKLFLQWKFYAFSIFIILAIAGWQLVTAGEVFRKVFGMMHGVNAGFTSSFMFFYLFIPFYNKLIDAIDRKQHLALICVLLIMYTIAGTFFFNESVFSYVGWYFTLYVIAAYFRKYPSSFSTNKKNNFILAMITIFLSMLSIVAIDFLPHALGLNEKLCGYYYYFLIDSNKVLALLVSVFAFLWFKNMKVRYNTFINSIAATTFGILLIHASSDAMRTFLWKDLLNVAGMYTSPFFILLLHAMASVAGIFIICSIIDTLRIKFLEKPLFKWIDNKSVIEKFTKPILNVWKKI